MIVEIMLTLALFTFFLAGFAVQPPSEPGAVSRWDGLPPPESSLELTRDRYRYGMRGSVRILIFWLGKDGVGGGYISRLKATTADSAVDIVGVEVLFGSDPDRVPGQANRWGYARELAFWRKQSLAEPKLERTLFEGFMSKSSEESLAQVRRNEADQHKDQTSPYEGLVSNVEPTEARAEIRRFRSSKSVNFKNPDPVGKQFERLLSGADPDETRQLDNSNSRYDEPLGFLSAIDSFVSQALRIGDNSKALSQLEGKTVHYAYNARLYFLELDDTKLNRKFKLNNGRHFRNVVKLAFKVTRAENGERHKFAVWTPIEGDMKGVPIRVEDRPRWWLKVELNLEKRSFERISIPAKQSSEEGETGSMEPRGSEAPSNRGLAARSKAVGLRPQPPDSEPARSKE